MIINILRNNVSQNLNLDFFFIFNLKYNHIYIFIINFYNLYDFSVL